MENWRQFIYAVSGNLQNWIKKEEEPEQKDEASKLTNEVTSPHAKDISSLEAKYGPLTSGMTLKVTLTDMLECCPRERKRSDAYRSLIKELKNTKNVELIVTSRKKGGIKQ